MIGVIAGQAVGDWGDKWGSSGTRRECAGHLHSTPEVPLSKAPNPQMLR